MSSLQRCLRRAAMVLAGALVLLSASLSSVCHACPFCSAPSLTLSEQFAKADAALLVTWVGGMEADNNSAGSTRYEILQVLRDPQKSFEKGKPIALERYKAGQKGDLALLLGTRGEKVEWGAPLEVTEASFQYIRTAPSLETPTTTRLGYFLKYLEHPDPVIANDAYAEFANAPYKDIVPLASVFPRTKIREWIGSSKTPATRLGLYGLMLGLCGTSDDARFLEEKVVSRGEEEFRLGIDGVMAGYLLLTGEKGLEIIERTKLKDKTVPFSETYAGLQALRFMWQYAPERIEPERLKAAMRILLNRPEMADIVIADLARWKDWSQHDNLMTIYGSDEYNVPSIKRAIVRYMFACTKDLAPKDPAGGVPAHVTRAKKALDELRKRDPKIVSDVERFQ